MIKRIIKITISLALTIILILTVFALVISADIVSAENPQMISLADTYFITPKELALSTYSNYSSYQSYYNRSGGCVNFFDNKGNYTVIYEGEKETSKIYISVFDNKMTEIKKLEINRVLPLFGTAIVDENENYYILWGKNVKSSETSAKNVTIAKYDSKGTLTGTVEYISGEGYFDGTMFPFDAGNASMIIDNGVITAFFTREMFSGHQSSTAIYADSNTMKPLNYQIPYTSHSFEVQVIKTSDDSLLFVDRGDAYYRGFNIKKLSSYKNNNSYNAFASFIPFHFREGDNSAYGYNSTYSQLGGIAESSAGYFLFGSSEKTLSLSYAPDYYRNESRNIFIQIMKKNFSSQNSSSNFLDIGETRYATGIVESGEGKHRLSGDITNYNVKWLTSYDNKYDAANPKIVPTDDDKMVILWEKWNDGKYDSTYYSVIDATGNLLKHEIQINARLSKNGIISYNNDKVAWSVSDGKSIINYVLDINANYMVNTKDKFSYIEKDNEIYIYNYKGSETAITIPDKIEDKPVTKILPRAFIKNTGLKELTLTQNLRQIDSEAFASCDVLTRVYKLSDKVKIAEDAFCDKIKDYDFTINGGKCTLNSYYGKNSVMYLPNFYNGKIVTEIGSRALYGNHYIRTVYIPDGYQYIGDNTFSWCYNLSEVIIPNSVTSISKTAFEGTEYFTIFAAKNSYAKQYAEYRGMYSEEGLPPQFGMGADFKFKGYMLASYTGDAENLVIPEGVKAILPNAIESRNSLKTITMPKSLVSIERDAIVNNNNLTKVQLSNGLKYIKEYALYNNKSLKELFIPVTVTTIESGCFYGTPVKISAPKGSYAVKYAAANHIAVNEIKYTAIPSPMKYYINDKEVQMEGYIINNLLYVKLRSFAYLIKDTKKSFNVGWQDKNGIINLTSGSYQPTGGETKISEVKKTEALAVAVTIMANGKYMPMDIYNINGNYFYKLADITDTFKIYRKYDSKKVASIMRTD